MEASGDCLGGCKREVDTWKESVKLKTEALLACQEAGNPECAGRRSKNSDAGRVETRFCCPAGDCKNGFSNNVYHRLTSAIQIDSRKVLPPTEPVGKSHKIFSIKKKKKKSHPLLFGWYQLLSIDSTRGAAIVVFSQTVTSLPAVASGSSSLVQPAFSQNRTKTLDALKDGCTRPHVQVI